MEKFYLYYDPRAVRSSWMFGITVFETFTRGSNIREVKKELRRRLKDSGQLSQEGIKETLKTVRVPTKRFPRQKRISKTLAKKLSQKRLFTSFYLSNP